MNTNTFATSSDSNDQNFQPLISSKEILVNAAKNILPGLGRRAAKRSTSNRSSGPFTETLESRRLYSTYLNPNGTLSISETQWPDRVNVTSVGGTLTVSEQIAGQPARISRMRDPKVVYIVISGLEGNDFITNNTNKLSNIDAGPGNDIVDGGYQSDIINGGDGNDALSGRGGNDTIYGERGDNAIYGGDGNDVLYTWDGADTMVGGTGNDYLRSYAGNDLLYGGDGLDSLIAGNGNDSLYGENGTDWLWGEDGNDYLEGGTTDSAPDGLIGGSGYDTFATHWVWYGGGAGWRNLTTVYDFQSVNYGWGVDKWVNP